MLNPNVIIPFDGNNADIPAGFERDTRFDGKFPKGASSGYGDTGGSDNHTHTLTHTHTMAAHTHYVYFNNPWDGETNSYGGSGSNTNADHSHNGLPGTPEVGTETTGSTGATLASQSNLPPYYEVIFIKSTGYNFIPVDGMVWCNGDRAGLTYHSGSANKFLRGAADGEDAGASATNSSHYHTNSHTHTGATHSHPNAYVNGGTNNDGEDGMNSPAQSKAGHRHDVTINAASSNINSNTDNSSTATGIEPAYITLKPYIATNPTLPKPGDIAMTTETTNPVGWITCDGNDDTPNLTDTFVKNSATPAATGGANTHTHTLAHTHTGNGTHTHTYGEFSGYSGESGGRNGSGKTCRRSHKHQLNSVSSTTADTNQPNTNLSDAGSSEPAYIKVRFIQLKFPVAGGALMAIL